MPLSALAPLLSSLPAAIMANIPPVLSKEPLLKESIDKTPSLAGIIAHAKNNTTMLTAKLFPAITGNSATIIINT